MGKLTKLFGLLTALLAVAAAVLSFMLAERRDEFRGRADKLAVTLSNMVKTMDADSGTAVQDSVSFTPGDPATGTPEEGTLGWKKYHEAKGEDGTFSAFQAPLDKGLALTESMHEQRNALAETMVQMGLSLGMPETDLNRADLCNLADATISTEAREEAKKQANAVQDRDETLINTVLNCGQEINSPINEDALRKRQTDAEGNKADFPCRPPLTKFSNEITGLNARCDDYLQAIVSGIDRIPRHEWAAKTDALSKKKGYQGALTSLENDFDDINTKLAELLKARRQIDDYKEKLAGLRSDVDNQRQEISQLRDKIAGLEIKNRRLAASGDFDPDASPEELEGKVVLANDEWNYVVLDLGKYDVEEGMEMLVAREDELLAKIQISKVYTQLSIAEVLPEINAGKIKAQDRVILPMQEK